VNYRTNEDKLDHCETGFNAIHNVDDISGSGGITEPVTLQEVKDYLRLEGFRFDDDSPADEFDFDDSLLTSMIIEGRMWCEKYTGIHLVPKTLQVTATNGSGFIELPGPVTGTIATTYKTDGTAVTGAEWVGTIFPKLITTYSGMLILQYEAGYGTDCPEWAKNAIKAYVAWAYEHRGDEELPGSPIRAASICRPYRRVKVFA
jgi:hypothetical protein